MSSLKCRSALVAVMSVGVVALLAACGGSGSTTSSKQSSAAATGQPWLPWVAKEAQGVPKLGISICQAANAYWTPGYAAASDISKALGITAKMVGPAQVDTAAQISQFNSLVRSGYRGIAVEDCGTGWNEAIDAAVKQGVVVVTVESDCPTKCAREAWFGTDYIGAGGENAKIVSQKVPPGSQVALTTIGPGVPVLQAEINAEKAQLSQAGDKVLGPYAVDPTNPAQMRSQMAAVYQGHPGLKAWIGCCSPDTAEAGRLNLVKGKKFLVIGQGELPQTLTEINQGSVYGTVESNPYNEMYSALMYLYERTALHQPPLSLPGDHYVTGGALVTKSGTASWIPFVGRFY